ncbi:MAG: GntR family transcriptional regulator [Clostridia bacterium]|nr:GntR family transcriptional regulator [Clostridia bacterium]
MEHKTVSLADQVFEHIEKDILSGVYARGDILTESHLSAELGVSRTPIREALRRLEQEHLIEETGKGVVVIGISEDDLEDIFLIRTQLEGLVCKSVAEKQDKELLEQLRETVELQEYYVSKKDPDHIKLMDNKFHELIYKMSGRNVFIEILLPLHNKIQKYRKASVSKPSRAERSVAEHKAILEAIESGDGQKAFDLSVKHIKNAYNSTKKA